jgi:hypothetical protein
MPVIINGFAYPALTDTQTSPSVNVGTLVNLDDGGQAVYVQAASEISQFNAVCIPGTNVAQNATTARVASTKRVGFAQVSIASGYYGWVQLGGKVRVNVSASCLPGVALYTTTTEGRLDDATVSGALVAGVVTEVTASATSAMTAVAAYTMVIPVPSNATP